jgi:hypothetical protein
MLKEHLARRKTRRTTIGGRIKDNLWKSWAVVAKGKVKLAFPTVDTSAVAEESM